MTIRVPALRALAPLALLITLCFDNASAASKTESSRQQLDQLHERIETLNKQLDTSKVAHAEVADELKQSEKAISEANRKLYDLKQQHEKSRNTLQTLEQEKSSLVSTLQQQQNLLRSQLYQQYLHGQQSYLQVILQQQDPGAISRELHYYSYVSRARTKLIESMQRNLGKVTRLNAQTASTLNELTALRTEQERERRELQLQKNERNKVLSKLSAKIKAQRGEISKLKRDEQRLSQLVERLARIAAKPKAKSKVQRSKSKATGEKDTAPKTIARNEALPTNDDDGGNFASLRGKLNLPVRGDISNRFGSAREDTGISWKGLFIRASEGSEVKAVASGRVVFADWLRGFGNLLIVDHGYGYMSLYGNNQSLLKKEGDNVKGGDAVATVGNTGGNESSGLYYELRRQSKPFDPLSWSVLK